MTVDSVESRIGDFLQQVVGIVFIAKRIAFGIRFRGHITFVIRGVTVNVGISKILTGVLNGLFLQYIVFEIFIGGGSQEVVAGIVDLVDKDASDGIVGIHRLVSQRIGSLFKVAVLIGKIRIVAVDIGQCPEQVFDCAGFINKLDLSPKGIGDFPDQIISVVVCCCVSVNIRFRFQPVIWIVRPGFHLAQWICCRQQVVIAVISVNRLIAFAGAIGCCRAFVLRFRQQISKAIMGLINSPNLPIGKIVPYIFQTDAGLETLIHCRIARPVGKVANDFIQTAFRNRVVNKNGCSNYLRRPQPGHPIASPPDRRHRTRS